MSTHEKQAFTKASFDERPGIIAVWRTLYGLGQNGPFFDKCVNIWN